MGIQLDKEVKQQGLAKFHLAGKMCKVLTELLHYLLSCGQQLFYQLS